MPGTRPGMTKSVQVNTMQPDIIIIAAVAENGVAGGAEIYAQALPLATRLVITEVHKPVDGDTRFPAIDAKIWRETARNERKPGPQDEAAFAFVTYERVVNAAPSLP